MRQLLGFARLLRDRMVAARCPQVASSLAFTTLLSLVPLLTVGLVMFGRLPGVQGIGDALRGFMLDTLLPEKAGQIIATYAFQFSQKAANLTLIGLLLVIVTAVMLMLTIDKAFNQIWAVAHPRPLLSRLTIYWVGLTLGPLALAAGIVASTQLLSLSLGLISEAQWLRNASLRVMTLLLLAAVFSLMYRGLPNRPVKVSHAIMGGAFSAVALAGMQRVFGAYIGHFTTYTLIYGTFAALPIFLLWLYLSWLIILVGATIVAVLPDAAFNVSNRPRFPGDEFLDSLQVLARLHLAQQHAETPETGHIALDTGLSLADTEARLEDLNHAGWVANTDRLGWVLTIRCEDIPLGRALRALTISPQGLRANGGPLGHALAERLEQLANDPKEDSLASLLIIKPAGDQIG